MKGVLLWLGLVTLVLYIIIDIYKARPEPNYLIWNIRHLKQYEKDCFLYEQPQYNENLILMYSFMFESDSTTIHYMYRKKHKHEYEQ